jgi:UDP-glucose:(heptosyl)LPS alpha-1,3-glucosyltransferase
MRLAIIRKRYTPYGGAERFIGQLAVPLSKEGLDITIVADSWNGQTVTGMQWIQAKAAGLTRLGREKTFHQAVQAILSRESFDLVQSHERFIGADICRLGDGLHRAWIDRYRSISPVWRKWAIAADPFHRRILSIESAMVAHPQTQFVANSTLIRDELQQYYGLSNSRITVIPNGVDTAHFRPATATQIVGARVALGVPTDAFVVSAVGSGFKRKGFFELIKAMATLPDVILLIAGKDKAAHQLKRLIDRLGLSRRATLLGPVQDVREVYWASDVFALPSLYDPSSNAVLEALASGLPVLTTLNVGSAREIIQAQAGVICSRTAGSIARGILECKEKKAYFSGNSRELALAFSQKEILVQWLALYERVLASRKNRGHSISQGVIS